MNLDELAAVLEEIRGVDPKAVPDGAVSAERYTRSKPRTVWILREVNDPGDTDWDLRTFLGSDDPKTGLGSYSRWSSTYGFVAKSSRAMQEGLDSAAVGRWTAWDARDFLRDIAVLNVNKSRGRSQAHWPTLRRAAMRYRPQLRHQLLILEPQLVIAAGTWELLAHGELGLPEVVGEGMVGAVCRDTTYWVRAPHPCRMRKPQATVYQMLLDALGEAGWNGSW